MERGIQTRRALRKEKGITLVALVITIVILIILAAVSINVIIEGGLIQRAKNSSEVYTKAELKEELDLILSELAASEEYKGKVPLDAFLDKLVEEGKLETKENVEIDEEGNTKFTTTEGLKVTVITDREGNVIEILVEGLVIGNTKLPENTKETEAGTEVEMLKSWYIETPVYVETSNGEIVKESTKVSSVYAVSDGEGETIPVPKGFY